MNTVQVVVPVLRGRTVFVVDRGRHWSVIEHLLLEALVKKDWTAGDLAQFACIPRRVVVEAIIRLMRAGWVELLSEKGSTVFRATARGRAVAPNFELPKVPELKKRPTNYIIDVVSGELFRNRDLAPQSDDNFTKRSETEKFIWIKPSSWDLPVDLMGSLELLLDPGETFVSAQAGGIFRRYVLVTVRNGKIVSGLPEKRPLPILRSIILEAAKRRLGDGNNEPNDVFDVKEPASDVQDRTPIFRNIRFDVADLVLDGPAHREVLLRVLKEARSRVYVHSTFISQQHVTELLPFIEEAVERGVKIKVFWGQSEDVDDFNTTQVAVKALRELPRIRQMGQGFVFHSYSTGSHAKIIIADTEKIGEYVAVVGSCNWFTSNFSSYEVSILLRDPQIVSDVAKYFELLTCIHDGVWSDLATEFVQIEQDLANQPRAKRGNATAAVVIGGHHREFVTRARDEALVRVFVVSHRLGAAARPGIIAPLIAAAKAKSVAPEVFYGRLTAPVKASAGARLKESAADAGVEVTLVKSPRLHAKVLAWDNDNVVVTSLNWLSADQVVLTSLKELGIFVCAPRAATAIISHFHDSLKREA